MKLSIVVIFHDMRREAVRTLFSLGRAGQTGIESLEYEIIAIDNGSRIPLAPEYVESLPANVRYCRYETASVSPVAAVNWGAQVASGEYVAVIVDGARMASPGLLHATMLGTQLVPEPFVFALAWHLGPKIQNVSMLEG